jgi:hypothetical protein
MSIPVEFRSITLKETSQIYQRLIFKFGQRLASQDLKDFQDRMQSALSQLTLAMSGEFDFVVLEPKDAGTETYDKLDAFILANTSATILVPEDFVSYRHGVRGDISSFSSQDALPKPVRTTAENGFTFATSDSVLIGSRFPIQDLEFIITTGANYSFTWQYWNGSWTNLSGVTDGTASWSTTGTNTVTFTQPEDWDFNNLNSIFAITTGFVSDRDLYWVRGLAGASPGSPAVIDEVSLNTQFGEWLEVLEAATPDLTVRVGPGAAIVNKRLVYSEDFTTVDLSSFVPTTNDRIVVVVINDAETISAIGGDEAASPTFPDIPENAMMLGHTTLSPGETSITNAEITDSRVFWHTPI